MRFIWLEDFLHDSTLPQNVPKSCNYHWVQHVYLQVISVSHMKAIERYSLAKANARDVFGVPIIDIPAVADRERLIDRKMKSMDIITS
jgi:hypothetical protein